MHANKRPGYARNRNRHILDPPHVHPRPLQVEAPLRDVDLAASRSTQPQVLYREIQPQTHAWSPPLRGRLRSDKPPPSSAAAIRDPLPQTDPPSACPTYILRGIAW